MTEKLETEKAEEVVAEVTEEPVKTEESLAEEPKATEEVAEDTPQAESEEEPAKPEAEEPAEEETPEAEPEAEEEAKPEAEAEKAEEEPQPEKDVEVLSESLSVVKTVRGELANAYKTQKEHKATIETLNAEIESFNTKNEETKKTIETLNAELVGYKQREEAVAQASHLKRLEELTVNFKELGQEKTVEELSKLPTEVIAEYEAITNLALNVRSEERLSAPTTVRTQATESVQAPKTAAPTPKSVEQLSTQEIMASITEGLKNAQGQ